MILEGLGFEIRCLSRGRLARYSDCPRQADRREYRGTSVARQASVARHASCARLRRCNTLLYDRRRSCMTLPDSALHPPQTWLSCLLHLWVLRAVPYRFPPAILGAPPWSWLRRGLQAGSPSTAGRFSRTRQFFAGGIPLLAWYLLAILGLAVLLRWRAHPASAFGPVLALTLGVVPIPLLFVKAWLRPTWMPLGIWPRLSP